MKNESNHPSPRRNSWAPPLNENQASSASPDPIPRNPSVYRLLTAPSILGVTRAAHCEGHAYTRSAKAKLENAAPVGNRSYTYIHAIARFDLDASTPLPHFPSCYGPVRVGGE